MKIIDVFLFSNELDMLELRLNEHGPFVDIFLLVESKKTFTNKDKELVFEKNKERFSKWLNKIEHLIIENLVGNDAWKREFYSRNYAYKRIKEIANDSDCIINTDLDEIVNRNVLQNIKNNGIDNIYSLEMDFYFYNCNWIKKKKWRLGSIGALSHIQNLQECRNRAGHAYPLIKNAGWHLSYFLTPENIASKISSFSHTEYDSETYKSLENIKNAIRTGIDLFHRGNEENLIPSYNELPKNIDILPKIYHRNDKRKIGFLSMHLSERGTTTALYDYAFHNENILGNKSIIFYQKGNTLTFPEYEKKFNTAFECYSFTNFSEVDDIIKMENIDALYIIKYGTKDNILVKNCPNLVHSVFVKDPHGEKYAFVSRFLSQKYGNDIPYIPHMIDLPKTNENLRQQYNIPEDATVFGGYGGKDSFNIPFVHQCINQIILENENIYFLFMNFNKNTIDHPRIIYVEPTIDREYKVKFINTCDAMIHARDIGETFGLAVGEFSSCNKRIITYYDKNINQPPDREHIRILGDKGIYYKNIDELSEIFRNFRKQNNFDWNCYTDYTPQKVMEIFEKIFLNIVTCECNNKKWTVFQNDGIGRHIIKQEGWEPHITKTFKELIKSGDTVLDIGANFGYHTIFMAEYVGKDGKVYAYEPEKNNHALLLRNIKNNNVSDIVIPQKYAILNEDKEVGFTKINWLANEQNMGDSYIIDNNINKIICKKLDDVDFNKVNLIKIDVQGCEVLTLKGIEKIIHKYQPYIIIEIEEYTLNRFGHTSKSLLDTVRSFDYTIFYLEYKYPSNHLCVPNSKLEQFMNKYLKNIKIHLVNNNINNNLRHGITQSISFP